MMQTLSVSNAPSFIDSTRSRAVEGTNSVATGVDFASFLSADAIPDTVNSAETMIDAVSIDHAASAAIAPIPTIAVPAIAALPLPVAASGKDLPVDLPESGKTEETPETAETIALALIAPQTMINPETVILPAPVVSDPPAMAQAANPLPSGAERGAGATTPALPATTTANLSPAGNGPANDQAGNPAPQPDTGAGGQAASHGRQQPADTASVMLEVAPLETQAVADAAEASGDFATGRTSAALPGATVSTQAASSATSLSPAARLQPTAALAPHDLAQVVERLAAAREAFAPAAAAMAIEHSEFGELSLRFEQRRDGQLAVQLAATDPEAHRAIVAAVAAERSNAAGSQSGQSSLAGPNSGNSHAGDRTDGSGREGQGTGRDDRNGTARRNGAANPSTTGRPSAQSGEILA